MERSRGYLVHRDIPGATQFLTWRLHDALSEEEWRHWREAKISDNLSSYKVIDRALDEGRGACVLQKTHVAMLALNAIFQEELHGNEIVAATVMPNHVHALIRYPEGNSLSESMWRMKGRSSREVNRLVSRTGRLWQCEYFDRVVRSPTHFDACVHYIHWNPVRAGLCVHPSQFRPSTAHPQTRKELDNLRDEIAKTRTDS